MHAPCTPLARSMHAPCTLQAGNLRNMFWVSDPRYAIVFSYTLYMASAQYMLIQFTFRVCSKHSTCTFRSFISDQCMLPLLSSEYFWKIHLQSIMPNACKIVTHRSKYARKTICFYFRILIQGGGKEVSFSRQDYLTKSLLWGNKWFKMGVVQSIRVYLQEILIHWTTPLLNH